MICAHFDIRLRCNTFCTHDLSCTHINVSANVSVNVHFYSSAFTPCFTPSFKVTHTKIMKIINVISSNNKVS